MSSETSAIRTQTPGNYPKRNKLHLEHGESLKTRMFRKATKTCTSAAVVSPYPLSSTPSTSSAMKTPENTEED